MIANRHIGIKHRKTRLDASDVNKAISIKAKDNQFVSKPCQGLAKAKARPFQGQAKAKAECLQEQDKPPFSHY